MAKHHGGDPARHLSLAVLDAGLDGRVLAPRDRGRVVALVTRQPEGARTAHDQLRLSVERGAVGDRWTLGKHGTDNQITAMESGVGELIANGQSLTLYGDNLILDLALDAANLPTGSVLHVGEVVLSVTAEPHTGCAKYSARFGAAALKAISRPARSDQRLRGIHLRVVRGGVVRVGDAVVVAERGVAPPAGDSA
jgi:MOSC domain-containing protein YiiM